MRKIVYKHFTIPTHGDPGADDEVADFLERHRVVRKDEQLVVVGRESFWAMSLEAVAFEAGSGPEADRERKAAVDYREILSPDDFAIYAAIRKGRNDAADAAKIASYRIMTNEMIANAVHQRIRTKARLRNLEGFGEASYRRCTERQRRRRLFDSREPSTAADRGVTAVHCDVASVPIHRMRSIPPGVFMMGSPENEEGRSHDERQHEVELTKESWLGTTPCTPALREAPSAAPVARHTVRRFWIKPNEVAYLWEPEPIARFLAPCRSRA